MLKRLFDISSSALGLLLLSPALLAIAIWIKLDTPGPVFFRQERIGRYGKPFRIHKFRSMVTDAALRGGELTIGADPRITRAGAFLRRTKLDELPQLFDVLRGAMSVVGPRPEVPRYVAMYPAAMRDKVLSVRPGITDIASVEFRDESAMLAASADPEDQYVRVVMPRKLKLAAQYVDEASFVYDLKLICRTIVAVWGRHRAQVTSP